MQRYFFILCDELGEEFDISVNAPSYKSALAMVEKHHPESSIVSWVLCNFYDPNLATYIVRG